MKLQLNLIGLFLSLSIQAFAVGPSTGGGGFSVACPATPVSEASYEMLDLFEAKSSPNFKSVAPAATLQEQYFQSVNRIYTLQGEPDLAQERQAEIEANLVNFFRTVKFVKTTQELPVAHDLGPTVYIPSQCQLQQIAFFSDAEDTVYVLQSAWDRFDNVSKAILVSHEIMSHYNRGLGFRTSELARHEVVVGFSVGPLVNLEDDFVDSSGSKLYGAGDATVMSVLKVRVINDPALHVIFQQLFGMPIFTKTWIDLPLAELNLKLVVQDKNAFCVVNEPGTDIDVTVPIHGLVSDKYSINFKYKTGFAPTISILQSGIVLKTEDMSLAMNCMGE